MPPKRKYKRKRRKRNFRKKKSKIGRWGVTKYNVHKYRRMGRSQSIPLVSNASGETSIAMQFNLLDVVNSPELTVLYDHFRIDYVQVAFQWSPKVPSTPVFNNPANMVTPGMYYAKDYDDDTPAASLTVLKERGNIRHRRLSPFSVVKVSLKPAALLAVIRDPSTTPVSLTVQPKWNSKIDCAAANTPHYGLKVLFDYVSGNSLGAVDVQTTYHLTMFGTR